MDRSRGLFAATALFITLICWSLSTPINSQSDEKFHLASIWCAEGFNDNCEYKGLSEHSLKVVLLKTNLCTPANTDETKNKRLLISRSISNCKFEFVTNEPLNTMSASPNFFYETNTQISAWVNPDLSPAFFYRFLNQFEGEDSERSVLRFRVVNSLLFIYLLFAFFIVAEGTIRESALIGLFFTMIPHGLFLISSVSNSSWSFTGCCFSWAFFYLLLCRPFRFDMTSILTSLAWMISSLIVVLSRYDSIIYLLITNFSVWILKYFPRPKRPNLKTFTVCFGGLGLALLAWFNIPQLKLLTDASLDGDPINFIVVLGNTLKLSIATLLRILGLAAPGWGPLQPSLVVFLINLTLFSYVTISFFRAKQRDNLITRSFVLGFIVAIFFVQSYTRQAWTTPFYLIRTSWVNDQFSPRYFIPYFPFLIGMLALTSKDFRQFFIVSKFKVALFSALAITQAITLFRLGETFRENPSWYWQNIPIPVNTLFFIGTVSFIFFLYFAIFSSPDSKRITNAAI